MTLRLITLEEHYMDSEVARATGPEIAKISPGFAEAFAGERGGPGALDVEALGDLGDKRLADMDAFGIDVQVLSGLNAQVLPPDVAPDLTRATNDTLAAAMNRHPDRFAGFASVPTSVPGRAGDELRRAVGELGMSGTLVLGRTEGRFLSDPRFEDLLAAAEETGAPVYLHPSPAPLATTEENYGGFSEVVTARLQTAAWGWHQETAVHFMHLVLSGVFDRHPDLKLILGHWGEMIPFFLERLDEMLPTRITGVERSFAEYMRENVWITPSGMFTQANLQYCVETIGADRIMYSVDYPFVRMDGAQEFLREARLDDSQKEAIAHGTAERVLPNLAV